MTDIIQIAIKKGCKYSNNGRHLQDMQTWLRNEHEIHVNPAIFSWSDRNYKFVLYSPQLYINSAFYVDMPIIGNHDYVLEKGLIIAMNHIPNTK